MTFSRRISSWLTCLAILMNLLAVPLHARQMQLMEQMPATVMSDDCAMHDMPGMRDDARRLIDVLDPHPHKMQHGDCCCSGSAGMAGPLVTYHRPYPPHFLTHIRQQHAPVEVATPRVRWTSLNPRASPLI